MPVKDSEEMRIPYLMKRGDSLRYRRIVPVDARKALGGKVVWSKTYKPTTAPHAAFADAERLARQHDTLIARARSGEVLDPKALADDEAAARALSEQERLSILSLLTDIGGGDPGSSPFVNAMRNGGKYIPEKLSITAALGKDEERYANGRDARPFDYGVETFAAIVGAKDVREINRADAFAWIKQCRKDGLAETTIARRANSLRALLTRTYLDLEIQKPNPFTKLGLSGKGAATDRLPFHTSHLALIDSYIANSGIQPDTRNLFRLLKLTGAGPAEIGGLLVADVKLDADIPHIWIRANALRGLKTKVRERRVPLILEALDAARDAVERAKGRTSGQLFAAFGERGADKISASLNKAIRRAGIPVSSRLTAYSFRHSMIEALRAGGVQSDLRRLIVGHAAKDSHDRYGSPAALLSEAREALLKAVHLLGNVEGSSYTAIELSR